jgi:hypothetical protein
VGKSKTFLSKELEKDTMKYLIVPLFTLISIAICFRDKTMLILHYLKDPQMLGILVALVIGIAGIFQDWIRSLFFKPKLNASIELNSPWCLFTPSQTGGKNHVEYYMRFLIKNNGKYKMENVEVVANAVLIKNQSGTFDKFDSFTPLNLHWSHPKPNEVKITVDVIHQDMFKFCDFGYIAESQYLGASGWSQHILDGDLIRFHMDTEVEPYTRSNVLGPGEYEIEIIFSASNLNPITKRYNLKIYNVWDQNDVSKMLKLSEI